MRIAVIGLWHQGVVAAACLADMGHEVRGADTDPDRYSSLRAGRAPVYEPGLDDLIRAQMDRGALGFTDDPAVAVGGAQLVFVSPDTPVNDKDESDLSSFFEIARQIGTALDRDAVVVITAQVPVGSSESFEEILRAGRPDLRRSVVYIPENLRLGQALERFRRPPLPVMGSNDAQSLELVRNALAPMGVTWVTVGLRTAEMVKHAMNTFLAASITFANELGNLCDEVGADGHRVAEVLRMEPRVGPKAMLFPGLGFAGGTLARDVQTLRRLGDQYGIDTPMLDGLLSSNLAQNALVVRKLKQALGEPLRGRRVAILGLTYKPDTSTLRRSAAMEVIGDLGREGVVVQASDPKADDGEIAGASGFTFYRDPMGAVAGVDAVVLMTPWRDYRTLPLVDMARSMKGRVLVDTANLWTAADAIAAGFVYLDIGRGRRAQTRGA